MTDHGSDTPTHDELFEAMVRKAVATVVDFNEEQGEEAPDSEDLMFCEELTRRVFASIGLQSLLDAGECMADQGVLGCIGWDRTVEPFRA